MESFDKGLKLKSLEMLAHREMENFHFCFTQECSNDRVSSQHWTSPFIEGMHALSATVHVAFTHAYSTFTWLQCIHMATLNCLILYT